MGWLRLVPKLRNNYWRIKRIERKKMVIPGLMRAIDLKGDQDVISQAIYRKLA